MSIGYCNDIERGMFYNNQAKKVFVFTNAIYLKDLVYINDNKSSRKIVLKELKFDGIRQ